MFNEHWLPSLEATAGARALLERPRDTGLRLVVATSAGTDDLNGLLRQSGIADLVALAATSSDAEQSKLDPDIVPSTMQNRRPNVVMQGIRRTTCKRPAPQAFSRSRCGGCWNDRALWCSAIYDDPADLLNRFDATLFGQPSLHEPPPIGALKW